MLLLGASAATAVAAATLWWYHRKLRARKLTLLQFNVLCDSSNIGCIDAEMKSYARPDELEWRKRCAAIAAKIKCADVAFLEEVLPQMFHGLRDALPDFDAWHSSDLVDAAHKDGQEIALFVRRATMSLIGAPQCRRCIEMAANDAERQLLLLPHHPGDCKPENYSVLTAAVRRRGWSDDQCIVVGGVHLRWEYGDMPAARGKPLQALCAARALLEHARSAAAEGVALAGDFNSWPQHGACLVLKHGLCPQDPEHPGGGCGNLGLSPIWDGRLVGEFATLRSAYAEVHGAEPRFTRKKNTTGSQYCLDYVFVVGEALRATRANFGPGPRPYAPDGDGSDLPYLPCAAWPSDHLPVVVDLVLPS